MLSVLRNLRRSVFAKVFLFVSASVFIILFLSFYIFEEIGYKEEKQSLLEQQKFITQSQSIIVAQHMLDKDEERITLTLSGVLSNPFIVGVAIYEPGGAALLSFGEFESSSYQFLEARYPITTFDGSTVRELGTLLTVSTDRQIIESLRQNRKFYALVFVVLFFVIIIATYSSIHLFVAAPMNRLVAAIKRSKNGAPISVGWSSDNEIGLVIKELENLQYRQFRVQKQLRKELKHRGKILTDLRVAKEAAEGASRSKTAFLATMSHELRTPLNAIIGFSEVIKSQSLGKVGVPRYLDYLQDIHDSGMHLLSIINDILDMSKIEANQMDVHIIPCDMMKITDASIRLLNSQAMQGQVTLESDIPTDLPACLGDPRMIKQVLINLLSNAIKFTPENGTVTLAARTADDGLIVSISDTGIGIPADKIDTVLEPFAQVDSGLEREYEGTGLGLPLAKSMVELQGGTLTLRSRLHEGTTVEVRFPPELIVKESSKPQAA